MRNSASRRVAISRCPRTDAIGMATRSFACDHFVHRVADVGGDSGNRAVGVEHDDASGLSFCDREKAVAHLAMELGALAFEAIGAAAGALGPRASALEARLDRQIEHDCQIGRHVVGSEPVQFAEQLEIEAAAVALVSGGRIGIAIGNHYFAGSQRGPKFFAHVLRAVGQHQQQFSGNVERDRGIEKNRANRFAGARAAGLMRDRYGASGLAQRVAENRGLRRFPAALDAFERNKKTACHIYRPKYQRASSGWKSAKTPAASARYGPNGTSVRRIETSASSGSVAGWPSGPGEVAAPPVSANAIPPTAPIIEPKNIVKKTPGQPRNPPTIPSSQTSPRPTPSRPRTSW